MKAFLALVILLACFTHGTLQVLLVITMMFVCAYLDRKESKP